MSQEQAKQFIDQATQSLQSGQFQQALELVDQAIALAPNDSESHVLRAIALSQTGQPNEATEAFRQAIMLAPYNAKAYYNLAVHQYSLGNKVEALEMAREAAKIDTRHAGARQLMTTIEGELHAPVSATGNRPANLNDPLSGPAAPPPADMSGMPPGVSGAIDPSARTSDPVPPTIPGSGAGGPADQLAPPPVREEVPVTPPSMGAPQNPYNTPTSHTPPPGGYYRQGYESSSVHSLPIVEKLGGAWVAIGWVLAGLSLVSLILFFSLFGPMFSQAMADPTAFQRQSASMAGSPTQMLLTLLYWGTLLGGILFTVLDLVDRRGNFLWLIPQVVCGCCWSTWLILPIYMLAGRKS